MLLRRLWFRAYPTFLLYSLIAMRAMALDVSAVDKQGAATPEGTLHETYQGLDVSIHDQVAAVKASYQFKNDGSEPLELTCNFQLQDKEMIDGFSYWNGSERILGEVLEKQTATQIYQEISGVNRDPGLLEQDGEHFRFRVFPVKPKEVKPVEITSVVPLSRHEGTIDYVIPKQNLPQTAAVFSLHVDLTDSLPIEKVEVLGVPAQVTQLGPQRWRVVYEAQNVKLDRDLVIRYRLASDDYALRMTTHREGNGDGTFMLIVSPKNAVKAIDVIGRDLVLVTDISGSMSGGPLEQSKAGLTAVLSQLSAKDRFEVVSFDDENYPLFGKLVPADDQHKQLAADGVKALEVKGGTNIHGALLAALKLLGPEQPGRPRAIVFLTDGQGDEPAEVVAADMRKQAGSVRIYSVGAGDGVNRSFLQRLADDNRGTATFVSSNGDIGTQMSRLYERISMPLMIDLNLDFGGLVVSSVYPKRLPDLYRDGEVVVFGRYKPGAGKITLRGKLRDGDKTIAINAKLPEQETEHGYIEKLWAARRIDELQGMLEERGENPELVQEITRLGIVYNLVTPYTTFLAVPESLQTDAIKQQIRDGKLGYDKKLIDSIKGIELSQAAIPPGDPVLSVDAPADARDVTAYFPFGLVKRLAWDAQRSQWYVRFLVPRDVKDGQYTISVRTEDKLGHVSWKDIQLAIDGTAPELEVHAPEVVAAGELMHVEVDPLEPVKDVWASLPGVLSERFKLTLNPETGLYETEIRVPDDLEGEELALHIVAHDLAKNRVEQVVKVSVYFCQD